MCMDVYDNFVRLTGKGFHPKTEFLSTLYIYIVVFTAIESQDLLSFISIAHDMFIITTDIIRRAKKSNENI